MKRFIPAAAIFILVALVLVALPVYAVAELESYQTSARTTIWGAEGQEYDSTYYTVWMKGTGLTAGDYWVAYWDKNNVFTALDTGLTVGEDGILLSEYELNDDTGAAAGLWHAGIYDKGIFPSDPYDADDENMEADDSFNVLASAIPEFPTAIVMFVAMGLSLSIYYWMRQRYRRQVVTVNSRR